MPTLTQDQVDQIVLTLGYSSVSKVCELAQLSEPYSQVTIDRVDALLLGLAALDQKLVDATADSMAVGVGQLNLNYAQHVAHLKSEGSRSLRELSQILGVRLAYNKYAGASTISIRSYW
jgi:hypothetical protein